MIFKKKKSLIVSKKINIIYQRTTCDNLARCRATRGTFVDAQITCIVVVVIFIVDCNEKFVDSRFAARLQRVIRLLLLLFEFEKNNLLRRKKSFKFVCTLQTFAGRLYWRVFARRRARSRAIARRVTAGSR